MESASPKGILENESPVRDRLLHIADIHFWRVVLNPFRLFNKRFLGNLNVIFRRRREFAIFRAEEFADVVAGLSVDQVLLTGDLTSTATDAEFRLARRFVDGLAQRGLRVWLLPGNHDVYTYEARRARRFERHFDDYLPAQGYPALERLSGGTPLLLAPTVAPNFLSSRGIVTPRALDETQRLVDEMGGRGLAAGHYPLLNETPTYSLTPGRCLTGAESLREAIGATAAATLYVCGHTHRFSYVRDETYPGLSHLCTGAFLHDHPKTARLGEFSEIHVTETGFRVFRHRCQPDQTWARAEITPGTIAPRDESARQRVLRS